MEGQSVYGLKPCAVRLQFDPDKLSQVSFDCGREIKVIEALEKQFGNPSQAVENGAFWIGEKTNISMNIRARTFAFIDRALDDGFQGRLAKYVAAQSAKSNVPASESGPTPGATPP